MSDKEILFRFKTVQTNAIRILFESLKNILSDVNFKADSSGLKLTTIDGTQTAIVNLFLLQDKFEEYICNRKSINIGINLLSVFKILKGIKHMDTISFTIYLNDDSNMYIECQNSDKKSTIISKIKLLDMCGTWVKVEYNGIKGWVNNKFLCGNPLTSCC